MKELFLSFSHWFCRTIPAQIFLFFFFFLPDTWVVVNPFPAIYYAVLYYWLIYEPTSIPIVVLLVATLFFDSWTGLWVGQTFFEVLFFAFLVLSQQKHLVKAPFMVVWACFVFFLVLVVLLAVLFYLLQEQPFRCINLLYSLLWVTAMYPLVSWGLSYVDPLVRRSCV